MHICTCINDHSYTYGDICIRVKHGHYVCKVCLGNLQSQRLLDRVVLANFTIHFTQVRMPSYKGSNNIE